SRRALLGHRLGYVAQDPYAACDPIRTVRHHIQEAWRAHGSSVAPDVIEQRISALGIGAAATRLRERPHQVSGGMLPRASLSPATTPPVVTIDRVSVTYRSGTSTIRALRDASLTVHAGEIVGIAGPSGSGKSTLLRIASGIEHPESGTVTFAAGQASAPRGYVMPVFQDPVASLDRRWPIWRSITEPATVSKRLS